MVVLLRFEADRINIGEEAADILWSDGREDLPACFCSEPGRACSDECRFSVSLGLREGVEGAKTGLRLTYQSIAALMLVNLTTSPQGELVDVLREKVGGNISRASKEIAQGTRGYPVLDVFLLSVTLRIRALEGTKAFCCGIDELCVYTCSEEASISPGLDGFLQLAVAVAVPDWV